MKNERNAPESGVRFAYRAHTARLPEFIGEKRLNHTFFVEKEVVALAESLDMVYNISDAQKNDLRAAALLHDITKEMPLEKQLELCGKYGIDAGKYPSCAVLHGAHGRLPSAASCSGLA